MSYNRILIFLVKLLGIRMEISLLKKPSNVEHWHLNPDGDTVYEIYITSWKKNKHNAFGFWKYDQDLNEVSKKALVKLIDSMKWEYKRKLKRLICLK